MDPLLFIALLGVFTLASPIAAYVIVDRLFYGPKR